jgi:tetratricopeptide (TPR) repeat protein
VSNQITPISISQIQGLHTTRPIIFIVILLAWIESPVIAWPPGSPTTQAGDSGRGAAQSAEGEFSLEPGKPVERELSGGQSHFYKITTASGQYLRITVGQRGIDALVALFTPDGKKIGEADSEKALVGSETMSVIAEAAGAYRIEARSAERTAKTGRYEIKVEELREATVEDKYRVAAEALFREAGRLKQGTLEAKRKGVEKYHEVLELYRRAGDRRGEAVALNNIGEVYLSLGELRKALEKFDEALPIFQTVMDHSAEAGTLNNIGDVNLLLGELQKALEKYYEALPIFRVAGDRRGESITLSSIGLVYKSLGELPKALEKYNEALPILQAVGDRDGQAATLTSIGAVYQSLGEMRKALEKHNEALLLSRAIGDRSRMALTLNNIGMAHWSLGDMRKALENYDEALSIFRAMGERRSQAVLLPNIGTVYLSLGEAQKALERFNEALTISRAIGHRHGEAVAIHSIGLVHGSLGEAQKALEKYDEALPIFRAVGERRGEALTLGGIGLVYQSLGELRKALEKYDEALPIFRAVGDRAGQAAMLTSSGMVYQSLGEAQKALEKHNEALALSRAIGFRSREATTLNNIGETYRSLGELRKALENYEEALPIFREVGERRSEAITLTGIGEIYRSLGETQKALDKFNESLQLWRAVGDRNGEAATLLGIARGEQTRGDLMQARQTIEQAIGIVESMRADIRIQDLRASYFASRQKYYESYIVILLEQRNQNPAAGFEAAAFAASERARARSLLELLTESRADIRQGVDSSLLERERSLQRQLNAKAAAQFALLNRKHTPAQAEAFAKEISSITTEYEELRAQIRARSPRYAALTQPQPLSLAEIQRQVLDPETLLLEYSLGDNVSHLFVVSQTSITWFQLPRRAEIEAVTRRVRELLTAPQPRPGDTEAKYQARIKEARDSYWSHAAALSRMLLGPAAPQLGGKRLLIVADGALQYLPFGALPAPEMERSGDKETGGQGDKRAERQGDRENPQSAIPIPLIVNYEIAHLPSASALAVLRRELAGRETSPKTVAVLADPVFSADDARVKSGTQTQSGAAAPPELTRAINDVRGELGRLLLTRDEAEAILSATPRTEGFGALDFRANRATATGDDLSHYRIVHFATHSLLNSEHPELSGIVLSLVDERGQPQDGFLRLHEIFNLRLPAELVVLSACQTGLGKEVKGEGLVGLTRGFMYAGAARVVASLWQVNDVATAELMNRFYRRMLKDGMRPAAALRAAQIEMWKKPQWQSPFYWGGFVLQGEWK